MSDFGGNPKGIFFHVMVNVIASSPYICTGNLISIYEKTLDMVYWFLTTINST